jgi:hypothetical protein
MTDTTPNDGAATHPDVTSDTSDTSTATDTSMETGDGRVDVDISDAFPIPDGPLAACFTCVRDSCATELSGCVYDNACRAGLTCTLGTCLSLPDGAMAPDAAIIDFACINTCFTDGGVQAEIKASAALPCVGMYCGAICGLVNDAGAD